MRPGVPTAAGPVRRLLSRAWVWVVILLIGLACLGWYVTSYLGFDLQVRLMAALIPPLAILVAAGLFLAVRKLIRSFAGRNDRRQEGVDPSAVRRLVEPLRAIRKARDDRPWLLVISEGSRVTSVPEMTTLERLSGEDYALAVAVTDDMAVLEMTVASEAAVDTAIKALLQCLAILPPRAWSGLVLGLGTVPDGTKEQSQLAERLRRYQSDTAGQLGRRLPVWLMECEHLALSGCVQVGRRYGRRNGEDIRLFHDRLAELSARSGTGLATSLRNGAAADVPGLLQTAVAAGDRQDAFLLVAESACRPLPGRPAGPLAGAVFLPPLREQSDARHLRRLAGLAGGFRARRSGVGHPALRFALTLLVTLPLLGAAWSAYWFADHAAMERDRLGRSVEALSLYRDELAGEDPDETRLVRANRRLSELVSEWRSLGLASMPAPQGLYRDRLATAFDDILFHSLDTAVREPTRRLLEDALDERAQRWRTADEDEQASHRQPYYELLATYLMLTGHPDRLDVETATPVLRQVWASAEALAPLTRVESGRDPVRFYLQRVHAAHQSLLYRAEPDSERVATARRHLNVPVDVDHLYASARRELESTLPSVTLEELTGVQSASVLAGDTTLSRLWTREGWLHEAGPRFEQVARNAVHGDWVLGREAADTPGLASESSVLTALWERYEQDYADRWRHLMGDLRLQGDDPGSLAESLAVLSDEEEGIDRLLLNLGRQLQAPDADSVTAELRRRIRTAMDPENAVLPPSLGALSRELPVWYPVLSLPRQRPEQLTALRRALAESATALEEIAGDNSGEVATEVARTLVSGTDADHPLSELDEVLVDLSESMSLPPSVAAPGNGLLARLVDQPWQAILQSARRPLRNEWRSRIHDLHSDRVQNRYPFAASERSASVDAIEVLLKPEAGRFWRFLEQNLDGFGRVQSGQWREFRWRGRGIGLSSAMTGAIAEARAVRQALFSVGDGINVPLAVYPVPASGIAEIRLQAGDARLRYRNEPQVWHDFDWRGGGDGGSLRLIGQGAGGRASLVRDDTWAIFRLIDAARVRKLDAERFEATWTLELGGESRTVRMRFRTDSRAMALFTERGLRRFGLPSSPFGGDA